MKPNRLLLLCFCLLPFYLFAGRYNTDSLMELATHQQGKARVDTWNMLAMELQGNDVVKARYFAREAINWSEKNHYDQGVFIGNMYMAYILVHSGYLKEGEPYLEKAIRKATDMGDSVLMARAWNLKGDFLYELHDYEGELAINLLALRVFRNRHDTDKMCNTLNRLALAYGGLHRDADEIKIHHELLDLATGRNDKAGVSATSNNLAAVHFRMRDYEQATVYFKRGLEAARKVGNKLFESAALHGLGNVAYKTGKLKEALGWYEQSVEVNKTNNFIQTLAINYMQMAEVNSELGKMDLFFKYNKLAGEIFQNNGMITRYASTLLSKADALLKQEQYEEALKTSQLFYNLGDSLNDISFRVSGSERLAKCYKALGDFRKSSEWLEQFVVWRDSLDKIERRDLARELESRYQLKEMKNTNAALQNENTEQQFRIGRQDFTISTMAVIGGLVVLMAILLFIGIRSQRKANALLEQKNNEIALQAERLREVNATKDKFFSIVAHDLKNPFGGLMNLSAVMVDEFDNLSKDELKEMLIALRDSSKGGYALLENLLEWSRSQTGVIEIHTTVLNLSALAESELKKQELAARTKNISLVLNIPGHLQTRADENMYRLIIRNLVSNAIKFTPRGGEITVYGESKHGLVEISVQDTGVGMDEQTQKKLFRPDVKHSSTGTANERGTGLGLLLCKEFIEKQQGTIWVESEQGKGSTFKFNLPLL